MQFPPSKTAFTKKRRNLSYPQAVEAIQLYEKPDSSSLALLKTFKRHTSPNPPG